MQELVPIKVRIGLTDEGNCKYPDFNSLSAVIRKNMDWSKYIDHYGTGWQYDGCCGHADHEDGDDFGACRGEWCGMICVPEDFADAAVAAFPNDIRYMTATETADFYDNRAHAKDAELLIDDSVLDSFAAKHRALNMDPTSDPAYQRAIDPNDGAYGIRKNHHRYFTDFIAKQGITIKDKTKPIRQSKK